MHRHTLIDFSDWSNRITTLRAQQNDFRHQMLASACVFGLVPRLSSHSRLVNQGLHLFLGCLTGLVCLENDAEDLAELLPTARHPFVCIWAVDVRRELLQQGFHWQREGDGVPSGPKAVPGHVCLLVEDGGARLLAVFALHRQ